MFFFQQNWFPLLFISRSSSLLVIQVNVDIKILWKERLFFFSKSPGAHVIYRRIERVAWNAKISPQLQHTPPPTGWLLTPSPSPSVCTLSVRSYADVITNFSRMDRWPNFPNGLRSRAWSSAKIDLHCHFFFRFRVSDSSWPNFGCKHGSLKKEKSDGREWHRWRARL